VYQTVNVKSLNIKFLM